VSPELFIFVYFLYHDALAFLLRIILVTSVVEQSAVMLRPRGQTGIEKCAIQCK